MLDKKSKIFFLVFALIIAATVAITYYKIVVLRDYLILSEVECDPAAESCFVYECDPKEDEDCSDIPEERISYLKKIEKKASNIEPCDPGLEECEEVSCEPEEEDCREILCDPGNLEEGEECSGEIRNGDSFEEEETKEAEND
ncbi:MAG: hypothetical protein ABIC19_04270 [Patescibacteria group bacterium]|nr:hypothetical protein [Patescibacteria group bacterium]